MAERRMFAKSIIDSDAFLDMSLSTQALYFHLNMRADDDGFINNPKKIQRMINASDDDMKILIAKNFIIPFESGVVVIKHWKIHNYIQSDRYKATNYQEELKCLKVKENKAYTLDVPEVDTECIHDGYKLDTQVRLGKVSIGKDNIYINSIKDTIRPSETAGRIITEWNTLEKFGIKPVLKLGKGTQRESWLIARLKSYTEDDFMKAIDNIRHSKFLQGGSRKGWVITFDWFIRPNNFPKVLEGNYNDAGTKEVDYSKHYYQEAQENRERTPEEWAKIRREHPDLFDENGELIKYDEDDYDV